MKKRKKINFNEQMKLRKRSNRGIDQNSPRRVALVTGASSGLGKALCELLLEKGFSLLATGRNRAELEKLKTPFLCVDLADRNSRKDIIDWIHHYTPDLIINNAGFGLYGDAISLSTQKQLEMVEVNITALIELTLESAKTLIKAKKRGMIINVSSAVSFFVYPSFAVYAASKTFVSQVSQALDTELEPYGIRVLSSCPGKIRTDFQRRAAQGRDLKREWFVMSPEKAARFIWKQIEQQKQISIFDWRYQLGVLLSYLFPKPVVQKFLRNEITKRFLSPDI